MAAGPNRAPNRRCHRLRNLKGKKRGARGVTPGVAVSESAQAPGWPAGGDTSSEGLVAADGAPGHEVLAAARVLVLAPAVPAPPPCVVRVRSGAPTLPRPRARGPRALRARAAGDAPSACASVPLLLCPWDTSGGADSGARCPTLDRISARKDSSWCLGFA
jgi:hypothetical protein